jgi:hypothetical protein
LVLAAGCFVGTILALTGGVPAAWPMAFFVIAGLALLFWDVLVKASRFFDRQPARAPDDRIATQQAEVESPVSSSRRRRPAA